jgi:putative FmdB family regulatory protein
MAIVDLRCRACEHAFQLVTRGAVKDKQKQCPACGSREVRQTLGSYLRNGALSDPNCGAPVATGFG